MKLSFIGSVLFVITSLHCGRNVDARWYAPDSGCWLEPEPTGADGPNLYQFNFNNPVARVDVNGLQSMYEPSDGPGGILRPPTLPPGPWNLPFPDPWKTDSQMNCGKACDKYKQAVEAKYPGWNCTCFEYNPYTGVPTHFGTHYLSYCWNPATGQGYWSNPSLGTGPIGFWPGHIAFDDVPYIY